MAVHSSSRVFSLGLWLRASPDATWRLSLGLVTRLSPVPTVQGAGALRLCRVTGSCVPQEAARGAQLPHPPASGARGSKIVMMGQGQQRVRDEQSPCVRCLARLCVWRG